MAVSHKGAISFGLVHIPVAFELLRAAMKQENKVAIAKNVMGNSETLLCIIPSEEGILVEKMFYSDEIKEIPKSYAKPDLNESELTMAKTLISSMVKPFEPELYKDEYQERLRKLIEDKISGKEIIAAKEDERGNVIDLMEALQRSIEQNTPTPAKKKRTSKKPRAKEA